MKFFNLFFLLLSAILLINSSFEARHVYEQKSSIRSLSDKLNPVHFAKRHSAIVRRATMPSLFLDLNKALSTFMSYIKLTKKEKDDKKMTDAMFANELNSAVNEVGAKAEAAKALARKNSMDIKKQNMEICVELTKTLMETQKNKPSAAEASKKAIDMMKNIQTEFACSR